MSLPKPICFSPMKSLLPVALLCCFSSVMLAPLQAQQVNVATQIQSIEEVESEFDLRCMVKRGESKKESNFTPAKVLLGYARGASASYLVLTISPDELRLSRVQSGQGKVLARAREFYAPPSVTGTKLVVQWRKGKLTVLYDGRVVLQQENLGELEGSVALQSSGDMTFAEAKLQPVEPVYFADDFMRMSNSDAHSWEVARGEWKVNSAPNPVRVANAFTYSAKGEQALSLAGRWFWNDYTVSAAVRPLKRGEVGLVAYYQDEKNYLLFKWLGGVARGQWRGKEKQLWRVLNGQATMMASAPGGYRANQWYRIAAGVKDGVFQAAIDDQIILQKATNLFGQGRAGLYENGSNTVFDDVFIYGHDNREAAEAIRKSLISPQFTKEESMSNWAKVKNEWRSVNKDGTQIFWHRGTYFGDHQVTAKVSNLASNGKAQLILNGDGDSPLRGYALEVTRPDDRHLKVVLLRDGKSQKEAQTENKNNELNCVLERKGNEIRGLIDDREIAFKDVKPLNGRRVAFTMQNARIEPENALVTGRQVHDYTFYRAPTDWVATRGEWDISSRWLCTKDWAWYGGKSERLATLWNKREFAGDYAIDVFAACQMDNDSPPYYNHPRDINITVAGDGTDPASGYSFIFGGWNNTATRILRRSQTVAESKTVLLPAKYHDEAHHKWFHLRVEKTGDEFSYFIDGKFVLSYRDAKPLPGRHIGLWTAGNGMMIARATIYYEKEIGLQSVLPPLREASFDSPAPVEKLPWKVRGDDKTVRLDAVPTPGPELAVRAISATGGGEFSIAPQLDSFDVFQTPRLSFDCRLAPNTEVNLYLKVRDKLHAIYLTGPTAENERDGVKTIGAATVVADDKWHTVTIDMAALLKPLYPETTLKVDELFLGNLNRDLYRQLGFGGNAPESEYQVRNFSLRSPDNRVARLLAPELKATQTIVPEPVLVRGLTQMRVTFCQDADGGAFKDEMMNKPIEWKVFSKPIFTAPVKAIDFTWPDQKSPGAGIRSTYWSARFYGKVQIATEGDYVFSLERLDDGGRLLIDGKPVLEAWKIQGPATHNSEPLHLAPGPHDIRLDYCQGPGPGSLALSWKGPGFDREIIPVVELKQP